MVVYTRLDTARESSVSNACHAIWDGNGGKVITKTESPISNTRHAVGNYRILTSCNKRICCSFNDSITIIPAIIVAIPTFYDNRGKVATMENTISYTRHAAGDGYGS